MHFADKLNSQTNLWDQNLYLNDKLVSTISTSKSWQIRSTKFEVIGLIGS